VPRVTNRWRELLLCCTLGMLAGCDSVVQIEGSVVSSEGEQLDDCTATLFLASTGEELEEVDLESEFFSSFTVGPVDTDFAVEVTCEGYSTYRSHSFHSSGVLGGPPAQLGDIVLEPLPDVGNPAPRRPAP
jgi:hypothetical protein